MAEKRNIVITPASSKEEPLPSAGESVVPATFDDDSMFNKADPQSAVLERERANRKAARKIHKTAPKQTDRRKTG